MRTTSSCLLLLVLLGALTGCSSASPSTSPKVDVAAAEDDAPSLVDKPVEPAFGLACHATTNTAPFVAEEEAVGTRPSFEGGKIEPGLYHRVRTIRFVSRSGEKPVSETREKQTLRISADGLAEVVHANEGGVDDPTSFIVTTNGSELRFTLTCPEVGEPQTLSYTATSNELTIARGLDGIIVYRRQ